MESRTWYDLKSKISDKITLFSFVFWNTFHWNLALYWRICRKKKLEMQILGIAEFTRAKPCCGKYRFLFCKVFFGANHFAPDILVWISAIQKERIFHNELNDYGPHLAYIQGTSRWQPCHNPLVRYSCPEPTSVQPWLRAPRHARARNRWTCEIPHVPRPRGPCVLANWNKW